jgi:DNA-binding transcriptional ArsR family regulator
MPSSNRRLRDPRELAALAHPVRVGILERLIVSGAMTATELGEALDESPANCSWHLRKLAEHGFVEEAEGARGRQRPWRASQVGIDWTEEDFEPRDRHAALGLNQMLLERWLDRLQASLRLADTDDPDWRSARSVTQTAAWVTASELDELNREVAELIRRYQGRLTDPGTRPEGSRLCELVAWGAPVEVGRTS